MGALKMTYPDNYKVQDNMEPEDVIKVSLQGFRHILQPSSKYFDSELMTAKKIEEDKSLIFTDPVGVLLNQSEQTKDKFIFQAAFKDISEKVSVLEGVRTSLVALVPQPSFVDELIIVADEMLTNAVFNAPFVTAENEGSGIERNSNDERLKCINSAHFFMAHDNERLMIGCIDYYGKLNVPSLLRRIDNCYEKSLDNAMNMDGPGGAGIGSFIIYNTSMSQTIGVLPGEKTIFCSVFPLKASNRQRLTKPKCLHLFY